MAYNNSKFSNSNGISFGTNHSIVTASYTVPTVTNSSWTVSDGATSGTVGRLAFSNSNGISFGLSTSNNGNHTITGSHNGLTSQSNQNVTAGNGGFAFQTLSFSNVNGFSFGTSAGSAITGSYTVPTQSVVPGIQSIQVSNTTYTTGNVIFSNANGLSFGSSAGGAVTGSYTVPTVTNSSMTVSDSATSGTLARIAFTNLNGVTLSLSTGAGGSHTIVGSHNGLTSQSNQNVTAANGGFAFQTLSFSNINGISFGTSAGSAITASHNGLTTARASTDAIGLNTAQTNVTWTVNSSGLSLNAGGYAGTGVTTAGGAGLSATLNTVGLSISIPSWLTTARGSTDAVGLNTAKTNVTWTVNSSGISLNAGGYAGTGTSATNASITLDTNGLAISVAAPSAALINFSAGTTSSNLGSVVFSNSNGLAFGLNGSTITGSYTVPVITSWTVSDNATSVTVGRLAFTNANGLTMTLSTSNNGNHTVFGSYTVPTVTNSSMTVSDSATSGTLARIAFTNLNGVTLSLSTGAGGSHTIVGSHNALTSQSNQNALAANGNFNFQTISFSNLNGVSFGTSAGSAITASHNGITSQTNQDISFFGLGNTTQNSSTVINASKISFNGLGAVTVGFSNGSIQISAPSAAAGNVTFSAGGASAGLASIVFSNSNGVSFGLNGSTITASAAGGGVNIAASNTTFTSGTVVMSNNGGALTISSGAQSVLFSVPQTSSLSGVNGISISTNGSTISVSQIYPYASRKILIEGIQQTLLGAAGQGSATIQYAPMDGYVTASRVDIIMSWSAGSSAAANTMAIALSAWGAIYTRNGATLNTVSSGSTQTTYSYASNSSNYTGVNSAIRPVSVPININMTPGEYYVFMNFSTNSSSVGTATTNLGQTQSILGGNLFQTGTNYAEFGSATATSINQYSAMGVYSATLTSVPPALSISAINQTGTAYARANINIIFRNY